MSKTFFDPTQRSSEAFLKKFLTLNKNICISVFHLSQNFCSIVYLCKLLLILNKMNELAIPFWGFGVTSLIENQSLNKTEIAIE
jgi:hypothetical protein